MNTLKDKLALMTVTALGLGLLPIAPGTWGALLALPIYLAIAFFAPAPWRLPWLAAAWLLSCVLSVVLCPWAERYWQRKDPGRFVLDEVAGLLLTLLLFNPPGARLAALLFWAFVATRIFDIIKLPPARQLERLPAGWGILLDDLAASLYAVASLYVLQWSAPWALGL